MTYSLYLDLWQRQQGDGSRGVEAREFYGNLAQETTVVEYQEENKLEFFFEKLKVGVFQSKLKYDDKTIYLAYRLGLGMKNIISSCIRRRQRWKNEGYCVCGEEMEFWVSWVLLVRRNRVARKYHIKI